MTQIYSSPQDILMGSDIKLRPGKMLIKYVNTYGDPMCDYIKDNSAIKAVLTKFKLPFPEDLKDIPVWLDCLSPRAAREIILELLKIPDFTSKYPY